MDNEYHAVIALTFDSNINAISKDTNMMEDAHMMKYYHKVVMQVYVPKHYNQYQNS